MPIAVIRNTQAHFAICWSVWANAFVRLDRMTSSRILTSHERPSLSRWPWINSAVLELRS